MKLTEITDTLVNGEKTIEGMNLRVIGQEIQSNRYLKRITICSDSGEIFVIRGGALGLEIYAEEKPKMTTKFVVAFRHKKMEYSGEKNFDSKEDAEAFITDHLEDSPSFEYKMDSYQAPIIPKPLFTYPSGDGLAKMNNYPLPPPPNVRGF